MGMSCPILECHSASVLPTKLKRKDEHKVGEARTNWTPEKENGSLRNPWHISYLPGLGFEDAEEAIWLELEKP
jgi:hypothetical protein